MVERDRSDDGRNDKDETKASKVSSAPPSQKITPLSRPSSAGKGPRIVIIGAGPVGLGAAIRLEEKGYDNWHLYEELDVFGGLSRSITDDQGFIWDIGGHILFSHYAYYDNVLDKLGAQEMYEIRRISRLFMPAGAGGKAAVVDYPLQLNLNQLQPSDRNACLEGIRKANELKLDPLQAANFEEWCLRVMGEGITALFMRPYNEKLWAFPLSIMNSGWVGDRVAVPQYEEIKKLCEAGDKKEGEAKNWGPNSTFKYPKYGGTGGTWDAVGGSLPQDKISLKTQVKAIDPDRKIITLADGRVDQYDYLISAISLQTLAKYVLADSYAQKGLLIEHAAKLRHSTIHIVGLGCEGPVGENVKDLCWTYWPDTTVPFFRCTLLHQYSPHVCPKPDTQYSLLFEASESEYANDRDYRNLTEDIEKIVREHGLIHPEAKVVSKFHQTFNYGYPTPCIDRDASLRVMMPLLESKDIKSRGRFGGWRYEVGNMDHSLMQGVEAAEAFRLKALMRSELSEAATAADIDLSLAAERTYYDPNFVNHPANRSKVPFTGFPQPAKEAEEIRATSGNQVPGIVL